MKDSSVSQHLDTQHEWELKYMYFNRNILYKC